MRLINIYLDKIRLNFPELKWNKFRFIQKGWSNDIVILDNNLVFRFPKDDHGKMNLKNEISLLDCINDKVGVKTPKYSYISHESDFGGYKLIPGREFRKSDIKDIRIRKNLAKQIGNFLTKLHSLPVKDFTLFEADINKHYTCDYGYFKYIIKNFHDIEGQIDSNLFSSAINFIEGMYPLKIEYKCMTHFDFRAKNIIFSEENKTINGVIDFSDSSIYDPAIDFSNLFSLGDAFVKEIFDFYECEYGNMLERAKFFEIKNFVFIFPDLIRKYPNKKYIYERKIFDIFKRKKKEFN